MRWMAIGFAALLCVADGLAQETGVLEGRIVGDDGEALANANLELKSAALSQPRGTASEVDGSYRVTGLPAGEYQVTITFIGYETQVATVVVRPGQTARLDATLVEEVILVKGVESVSSVSRREEKVLDAPASVAVVTASEIVASPALSVGEHVEGLPGVDIAQTGLVQRNVVVRGFNNVFSGTLLTLTDNRIARVPSLRLNAYNFIPVTNDDIERIEVVLGPGAALYGPNSANGVMHIITHSPFTSSGTDVQLGMGERSLRKASARHAGTIGERLGYKISGQYYTGRDWESFDVEEEKARERDPTIPERSFDVERQSAEVRLDYRASDELTAVLSSGFNIGSHIEMTGVGAGQAKDWQYNYVQLRLLYKDWFIQAFRNGSDAGAETFLLRSGDPIVDKSSLTVLQAQHTASLGLRQQFTYGFDALWTRPDTEGTITGQNEDDDKIDEYGGYLQSETVLTDQLDLVLALRYDYHNRLEDLEASPRAALVFKPAETQTLRLTYNKAFSTPTTNDLYLDLVSVRDAFGIGAAFGPSLGFSPNIDVRAQGTYQKGASGFTFRRGADGRPLFRSPFAPLAGLDGSQYLALDDPQVTNLMWGVGRSAVIGPLVAQFEQLGAGFLQLQGLGAEEAAAAASRLAQAVPTLIPEQLPGLRNALGALNIATSGFDPATDVRDVPPIQSRNTQTYELGYKGIVGQRLVVAADVYRSEIEDFIGSLSVETPNVFLDPESLAAALGAGISEAMQDPNNAEVAAGLAFLDGVELVGGNNNGSPVDELTRLVAGGAAQIPFGTITPEEAPDPHAVLLTYRNQGDVTLHGLDLSLAFYPSEAWEVAGSYSYVDKNFFEELNLALNAPQHKGALSTRYNFDDLGLQAGGRVRYNGDFRFNSGAYVGDVEAYSVLDLNASYRLPQNMVLRVEASNVLNNGYKAVFGAPEIGRLVFAEIGVGF